MGILIPKWVDKATGYRYFDDRNIQQARAILYLRELMFPLSEIREMLDHLAENSDILAFLEKHKQTIQLKLEQLNRVALTLEEIIHKEREAKKMPARCANPGPIKASMRCILQCFLRVTLVADRNYDTKSISRSARYQSSSGVPPWQPLCSQ